jgi:hypothetical protein
MFEMMRDLAFSQHSDAVRQVKNEDFTFTQVAKWLCTMGICAIIYHTVLS